MKLNMKIRDIAIGITAISGLLLSCGESKFEINGEVTGGEGKSLVLEKSDFSGRWISVDSTRIGKGGKFAIGAEAPASPEVYRLSLDDRFIYLPVDSVESLTLTTTADAFGHSYTLTGTQQAELMTAFETEMMGLVKPDSATLADFKRNIFTKYIKDGEGSILSYYVLTKIFDGKPLYDPADPQDIKYYSAVATQFDNYRPNDPHGKMVKEVSLSAMKKRNSDQGKKNVYEAQEINVIDIALPDTYNKTVKLSEIVGNGKPVVLIFSMMLDSQAPSFNRELARIYNNHRGAVEFYQVSFDGDQYEWREAARNLPWVNVLDPNGTASTALTDYNVGVLPAVFLYNSAGDLVSRPESLKDLESKL